MCHRQTGGGEKEEAWFHVLDSVFTLIYGTEIDFLHTTLKHMGVGESGAASAVYPSTHWSLIYVASQPDQQAGEGALNELLCRYYRPLLAHVQYKFRLPEDASREMVQGFVERKILRRNLLNAADRTRGRFRTFLLNALDNYVIDQLRKPVPSFAEFNGQAEGVAAPDAADPYDRQWALAVVEETERRTRVFYDSKGRGESWLVFRDGFLLPTRDDAKRPSDAELAFHYGFESARQVSNTIITVKRQFGKLLREVVRQYAASDAEVDSEIQDLMLLVGTK